MGADDNREHGHVKRVLVVAAHPDDEVLSVGGTIAKHSAAGDDVTALIISEGVSARYPGDHNEVVRRQSQAVADLLGISDLRLLDFPDQRLDTVPISELAAPVEDAIRVAEPDVVYTQWGGDVNRDHNLVAEATVMAARPYAAPSVRSIYLFESASAGWGTSHFLHPPFNPSYFVDIQETLDVKVKAFGLYESEMRAFPHPRSPEAIRSRAAYWGVHCGVEAAEAFVPVRVVR